MSTRAKMRCDAVEKYAHNSKVKLSVVYEGELGPNEENKRFTKATPSGEVWMTIDNPAAVCQFVPGRNYYVDFSEAPADQWNRQYYEDKTS